MKWAQRNGVRRSRCACCTRCKRRWRRRRWPGSRANRPVSQNSRALSFRSCALVSPVAFQLSSVPIDARMAWEMKQRAARLQGDAMWPCDTAQSTLTHQDCYQRCLCPIGAAPTLMYAAQFELCESRGADRSARQAARTRVAAGDASVSRARESQLPAPHALRARRRQRWPAEQPRL